MNLMPDTIANVDDCIGLRWFKLLMILFRFIFANPLAISPHQHYHYHSRYLFNGLIALIFLSLLVIFNSGPLLFLSSLALSLSLCISIFKNNTHPFPPTIEMNEWIIIMMMMICRMISWRDFHFQWMFHHSSNHPCIHPSIKYYFLRTKYDIAGPVWQLDFVLFIHI